MYPFFKTYRNKNIIYICKVFRSFIIYNNNGAMEQTKTKTTYILDIEYKSNIIWRKLVFKCLLPLNRFF